MDGRGIGQFGVAMRRHVGERWVRRVRQWKGGWLVSGTCLSGSSRKDDGMLSKLQGTPTTYSQPLILRSAWAKHQPSHCGSCIADRRHLCNQHVFLKSILQHAHNLAGRNIRILWTNLINNHNGDSALSEVLRGVSSKPCYSERPLQQDLLESRCKVKKRKSLIRTSHVTIW